MAQEIDKNLCTGLILAGGAGRRVDGRDKGLLAWRGTTFAEAVATRLRPQVASLMISCNRNLEQYAGMSTQVVSDTRANFQGPLAGIEAAAPLVHTPLLIVVACDTPEIPADLVARLTQVLCNTTGADLNISFVDDGLRQHYLCAAIKRSCLHSLKEFLDSGQRRVYDWFQTQGCKAVDFSDCPGNFSNHNYSGRH